MAAIAPPDAGAEQAKIWPGVRRIARSRPRSLTGNASGARSARIAMYCAVQSPMPGSVSSFGYRLLDSIGIRSNAASLNTAAASEEMALARA